MKTVIHTIARFCDRLLETGLVLLMLLLVICVVWQIVSRYIFLDPSSWTEELARFVLIWIGLLGAAYAYRLHAHIGIDLLEKKLAGNHRAALQILVSLAIVTFSIAVLIVGGTKLMLLTLQLKQVSATLNLPIGLVYLVLPLSGGCITLYGLLNIHTIFFRH